MSPEKGALIIAGLGLATALIWWVFKPRKSGPDVGLAVFHEDETDDLEELYRLPAADRDGAE